jgi:hypothetical protein
MSAAGRAGGQRRQLSKTRPRMSAVERVLEGLSARDWDVIQTVYRMHLAVGSQLERLHFHSLLSERSRSVVRGLALKRLVDLHVLITLDRRVGATDRSPRELCYALDVNGYRVLRIRANRESPDVPVRRPWLPGDRFVRHTLAVTELFVRLVELSRGGAFVLSMYQAKHEAHWPNGLGGWLRPDAFVQLRHPQGTGYWQYWWYEADRGTESLPTLQAKLLSYLDFAQRGQLGPDGIVPRVIVGVLTAKRQAVVAAWVDSLSAPAAELFRVADMTEVARVMADEIINR